MKYIISLIIFSFIIIVSCNTGKEKDTPFSQNNLPVTKFTINTERDTVLQTGNGALLKIPAGALENKNAKSVTLEIKEAYSLEQIIKAGLFTQSNGQPLSSGGMIYINAVAGQDVTFKQKIQVAIPADFIQDSMQLYKGKELEDGSINWEQPVPLPENKQQQAINIGQVLFESQCANCHEIGVNRTGPNLAHFMKRFPFADGEEGYDKYYLHRSQLDISNYYSENSHSMSDSIARFFHPDAAAIYKCNLRQYSPSGEGPIFDIKGDGYDEYLSIFQYIQNESDRLDLPYPSHAYLKDCADSCKIYLEKREYLKELKNLTQQERDQFIEDNGEMTTITSDLQTNNSQQPSLSQQDFDKKVSPQNFSATYYQFSVETFGWYNIDILLQDLNNGVAESELFVRIVGEYRERINIFLIIPSAKVYGEGGPVAGDDRYAFFYKTGKIPLPQNVQAYILAVSEQNEKIAFALKEFTTSTSQEFDLALETTTKEKFNAVLSTFGKDKFNVKINDSKNADSIRAKDKTLKNIDQQLKEAEGLKPKNCDCDCGKSDAVTTVNSVSDYYILSN